MIVKPIQKQSFLWAELWAQYIGLIHFSAFSAAKAM